LRAPELVGISHSTRSECKPQRIEVFPKKGVRDRECETEREREREIDRDMEVERIKYDLELK